LSEQAIRFVTDPDPATIHWMSPQEAADNGIALTSWGGPATADVAPDAARPSAAAAGRIYPDGSPERRAVEFVASLAARWSGAGEPAAAPLASLYTEVVLYYGKALAREAVLARKRRLAQRWRERSYAIRPASLTAVCTGAAGVCQV